MNHVVVYMVYMVVKNNNLMIQTKLCLTDEEYLFLEKNNILSISEDTNDLIILNDPC